MILDSEMAWGLSDDCVTLALLHDKELTPEVLAGLKEINFPSNLGMVPNGEKSEQIFAVMKEVIENLPDAPDTALMDNLAAEYAAIYLTGALEVSPFESFWVSDEHLLCQDAMFEMRTLYAASNLKAPDWRLRPDDHLVFELQFIAKRLEWIARESAISESTAIRDEWQSLAELLDHHLLRWLPDFAIRVTQRCDTAFYGALALITDAWCQQLRDVIALYLGEARPSKEVIEAMLRPNASGEPMPEPLQFMPGSGGPSW
jgi:TorA maturation chaperone TorD